MTISTPSPGWLESASSDPDLQRLLTPKISRYCPHAPTAQQTLALVAHRFLPFDEPSEIFYGGAAGGGKSDWLLMGALEHVDVPGYAGILFRRTFTDLSLPGAIMSRAHEWLGNTDAVWSSERKQWTFPSGATLQFAFLKDPLDELRYQSAEFQFVGFDELTQFAEAPYTYLFSRLRRPAEGSLSQVPLRMCAASNPGGIGHGWVKKRFPIDGVPRGLRVFVPAKIADNPHLDQNAYRKSLSRLGDTVRQQLEDGDWQVAEGLAFRFSQVHQVPDMEWPRDWPRFESMDFGVANPTCVLWWTVDYDGNAIVFDSYYQGETLVSDHAKAILARRRVHGTRQTYADPSMWARKGGVSRFGEPATDVTEFEDHGVKGLIRGNNHRRPGRIRITELLKPVANRPFPAWHPRAGEYGAPRMFVVTERCPELAEQLENAPLLPIDSGKEGAGEIVDPEWESQHGHAIAACRYGAMSRPSPGEEPDEWAHIAPHLRPQYQDEQVMAAELRAEVLRKHRERVARPRRRARRY